MNKSMLEIAYKMLVDEKRPVKFTEFVDKIKVELSFNDVQIMAKLAQFYTNLSLDGRFVMIGDNTWDLRSRNKFEKVHIDMNLVYTDDYEDIDALEEIDEEDELDPEDDIYAKEEDEEDNDLISEPEVVVSHPGESGIEEVSLEDNAEEIEMMEDDIEEDK